MATVQGSSRRSRSLLVVGLVAGSLGLGWLGAPAHADPDRATEAVGVQMGWDQAVYSITSSLVTSTSGAASSSQYTLDPLTQDQLPVRVRLSYQAGDKSGTDLRDLKGYSGRVLLRLAVENVTVSTTELSFEANGAKYRRYGLVGAP